MKFVFLRSQKILVLLATSAALVACGGGNDTACTSEARSSVMLTVLDTLGLPMRGYDVAFQIDKGSVQKITCESSDACAITYEQSGVFSMTVSKPGFNSTSLDVTVSRDECHVMTQRVTLTLKAF